MFFEEAIDNDSWKWLGHDSGLFHTLRSLIAYNTVGPQKEKKTLINREYLMIGTNGGGDYYCIKLYGDDESVYFYQHEEDSYSIRRQTIADHVKWLIDNQWGRS